LVLVVVDAVVVVVAAVLVVVLVWYGLFDIYGNKCWASNKRGVSNKCQEIFVKCSNEPMPECDTCDNICCSRFDDHDRRK